MYREAVISSGRELAKLRSLLRAQFADGQLWNDRLWRKADIRQTDDVGSVTWSQTRQQNALFDRLVGAQQEGFGNRQAECLRGLQVDDQLKFGGPFDRELGRTLAFENPLGQRSSAPVVLAVAGPIKHQASIFYLRRK